MSDYRKFNDEIYQNSQKYDARHSCQGFLSDIFILSSQDLFEKIYLDDGIVQDVEKPEFNLVLFSDERKQVFMQQGLGQCAQTTEKNIQNYVQLINYSHQRSNKIEQVDKYLSIESSNSSNLIKYPNYSEKSQKQQILFQKILKQKKIKGKFKKNTNVPKILVRIYTKHFKTYNISKKTPKLLHYHNLKKQQILNPKTNSYKIADIIELLQAGSQQIPHASQSNRETMSRIISHTMKQQILLNNFVKRNWMSYMIALKIYALRCRSRNLVTRVKIL